MRRTPATTRWPNTTPSASRSGRYADDDPGITDAAADDFEMGPFELFLHGDSRGA